MTQLDRTFKPVTVTLPSGDWDWIQGLITSKLLDIQQDHGRIPFTRRLEMVRRVLIEAQERGKK